MVVVDELEALVLGEALALKEVLALAGDVRHTYEHNDELYPNNDEPCDSTFFDGKDVVTVWLCGTNDSSYDGNTGISCI